MGSPPRPVRRWIPGRSRQTVLAENWRRTQKLTSQTPSLGLRALAPLIYSHATPYEPFRGSQMAVFELASAAARTWIVAANGSLPRFRVALHQQAHDLRGRSARVQQLGHRLHVRVDGFEKIFVSCAKIVQPRLAVRRVDESILRAFTQGQCLAMGMWFSEREKNLFAGHLRRDFLSSRA